jgi:beta-glucanase (GH16 family)
MKSQVYSPDGLTIPLRFSLDWTGVTRSIKRLFASDTVNSLLACLMIIGISLVLTFTRLSIDGAVISVNKISGSYIWLTKFTEVKPPEPKVSAPAVVSALSAATPTCVESPADAQKEFATCPAFSIDYSSTPAQQLGKESIFNTYVGAPEGNQEAQYYTDSPQNLQVEKGALIIKALSIKQDGFNYTSARIDTKGKKDFLYGKIIVSAKLPNQIGAWPAIWMLPTNKKYAGLSQVNDTKSYLNDGEIDIAESVGAQPHTIYGIAHSLAHPADGPPDYYGTAYVPDSDSAFHSYGVEWTPTRLTFTIDGQAYFAIEKQAGADYRSWPYDQPFYLILNLALGGSWGGIDRAHFPADGVDSQALPSIMQIQSINYYPYL